jgi:hypothetical protein
MVAMLQANEDRLVTAVEAALRAAGPSTVPTDEQIAEGLKSVGIWV